MPKKDREKKQIKRFTQTLAPRDVESIEKLVSDGRYKSRGDFVQLAVKKLLETEIGAIEIDEEVLRVIEKALKLK